MEIMTSKIYGIIFWDTLYCRFLKTLLCVSKKLVQNSSTIFTKCLWWYTFQFVILCKIMVTCLHWPEGPVGGGHGLVHIGLVPLLHLADLLPGGGVQGGECLPRDAVVPLVVNKNPSVLKKIYFKSYQPLTFISFLINSNKSKGWQQDKDTNIMLI